MDYLHLNNGFQESAIKDYLESWHKRLIFFLLPCRYMIIWSRVLLVVNQERILMSLWKKVKSTTLRKGKFLVSSTSGHLLWLKSTRYLSLIKVLNIFCCFDYVIFDCTFFQEKCPRILAHYMYIYIYIYTYICTHVCINSNAPM